MAILFAAGFALSAAVSALAVDAAALYHERRVVQSVVDLAALTAARDPGRALDIAQTVLVDAGLLAGTDKTGLIVTPGHYAADPTLAADQRFAPGAGPVNAVRVHFEKPGTLYFASAFSTEPTIAASGIASVTPEVSFSLGSRLASLDGGIANAVLGQLLGTGLSLSVMDYNALASARVEALDFLDALALQLGLDAGTYDDLLSMQAGPGPIAAALKSLTGGTANSALSALALDRSGSSLDLGKLIGLGQLGGLEIGSSDAALGMSLSVLEILSAAAALADGERQVSLNLGASLPGLASLKLDLAIGEPPQGGGWFTVGPAGTMVRTAQTRLRITAQLLGGAILLNAGVRLPIWLDLAHAEAQVISATCPEGGTDRGSAVIAVRPGAVHAAIGEMSAEQLKSFGWLPPAQPVRLIDVLLLRVTASAQVEVARPEPVAVTFTSADIAEGRLKTVGTSGIATSIMTSLLGDLNLGVNVLGLGLASPAVIAQAVRGLVTPLAPVLDLTLDAVLDTLGLGIGEADVRVYGVRCTSPVLVG
ncbi:MAG: hypothetical protein KIT02_15160 [Devosia sp.]|uniref:TadG family pilus assembly protein n=1 Tax=Devosia sp. TaxID=1871048 RepID=UPI0024C50971|nr:TadG family pilus assembly protein [Devosia sp.]UYN99240.1 MAG: hypothetical protein KIT02_15160 [Devosia sp.]